MSSTSNQSDSSVFNYVFYIVILIIVSTACTVYERCSCYDITTCLSYMLHGEVRRNPGASTPTSAPTRLKIVDSSARKAEVLDALVAHEVTDADLLRFRRYSQRTLNITGGNQQIPHGRTIEKENEEPLDLEAPEMEVESSISQIHSLDDGRNPVENDGVVGFLASTECSICMEEYKKGDMVCWSRKLACYHAFHTDCLEPWLMHHDICPNCRSNILPFQGNENLPSIPISDV